MFALYDQVRQAQRTSVFSDDEHRDQFIIGLIASICERLDISPSGPLALALYGAIQGLLAAEGFVLELPERSAVANLTLEEGVRARAAWKHHLRVLQDHERLLGIWGEKLVWLFSGILGYFPPSAFIDINDEGEPMDDSVLLPDARLLDLCEDLPVVLDRIIATLYDSDVVDAHLFDDVRSELERNLLRASGVSPDDRNASRKLTVPSDNRNTSPEYLVDTYLQGTPLQALFYDRLPFAIPFPARFEHTHIVAGSGHGKTQLLQFLIHHDLVKAKEDRRSVIVIDSQGDMIRTLSHLKLFDPNARDSLANLFVLIDPTDIEHPVGLNMFDFDRARLGTLSLKDQEMILNATVETYEYFFGALLGAELTQRQGVIFRYIARLMMEIPDATIHTLLELMMHGEKFKPYMEKLSGTAKTFFATQFFDRQFSENKKQIVARLWGVLSNTTLERMFSNPKNKVDLFKLTQEGKIILVNTAKDFLGQEGSAIFGRFIVSLIAQAALQRAAVPVHERTPTFAYIDEAAEYFDENIDRLVNQVRKYKFGLVFSHQNLDQLSPSLRASVISSTSIKFAGGLSSKDATALASEFRTDSGMLLSQKKYRAHTEFACYVKNFTGKAVSVQIPLGHVEAMPTLDAAEYALLVERNRDTYGVNPTVPELEIPAATEAKAPRREPARKKPDAQPARTVENLAEEIPEVRLPAQQEPTPANRTATPIPHHEVREQGGGGKQHRYLAHLVKKLAEDRQFKATIEHSILDGAAKVDVDLVRGERRIAVEISVTTGRDWELQNVEKCLAAGYAEIIVLSSNARHLKSLKQFINASLDEVSRGPLSYLSPEELITHLDTSPAADVAQATESVVKGYKVRVTGKALPESESAERRSAVAKVIAQSLAKTRYE